MQIDRINTKPDVEYIHTISYNASVAYEGKYVDPIKRKSKRA